MAVALRRFTCSFLPRTSDAAGFIPAVFVSHCSLFFFFVFSAGVSPLTCGKWHWSADVYLFIFFPRVPLASDTSVPQLRISLKTFDKSRSPRGISRDSLNPQLGQTDCQRGLTDLGAVCLCSCTTTRQRRRWRAVCAVWLASAERDLIAADAEFLCVASSSHPLWPSPCRAGWLNKWRASAVEVGSERNAKTPAASEISHIFHPWVQYSPGPSAPVPSPKDRKTNSTARILTLVWSIPRLRWKYWGHIKVG